MIGRSMADIIQQLEDQKIERGIAFREALYERKRAFEESFAHDTADVEGIEFGPVGKSQQFKEDEQRHFQVAKLQYAYPYKVVASIAVTIISGFSAYRHKSVLHLIPAAVAIPYLAHETDACYGKQVKRLNRQADLLYRKRLSEHEPHILIADVRQRLKELQERNDDAE